MLTKYFNPIHDKLLVLLVEGGGGGGQKNFKK